MTGAITIGILSLDKKGFRPLEIVIAVLVTVIGLSYLCELVIAPPNWHAAIFHTFVPHLHGNDALMLAVGIIGATIMPHTIYLHSGLTQNRVPARNNYQRRKLVRFSNREVVIALGFAGLVNLAMVAMSASVFSKKAPGISDFTVAYHTLTPVLGAGAAALFLDFTAGFGYLQLGGGNDGRSKYHAGLCRIQDAGAGTTPHHDGAGRHCLHDVQSDDAQWWIARSC